jgi:hypothetical protein
MPYGENNIPSCQGHDLCTDRNLISKCRGRIGVKYNCDPGIGEDSVDCHQTFIIGKMQIQDAVAISVPRRCWGCFRAANTKKDWQFFTPLLKLLTQVSYCFDDILGVSSSKGTDRTQLLGDLGGNLSMVNGVREYFNINRGARNNSGRYLATDVVVINSLGS